MLHVFDGAVGLQRCRVYLEDDRIEIGRLGIAYVEDLTRATYRDVHAVTFTPGWYVARVLLAGVLLLGAAGVGIGAAASADPTASILGVVALALLVVGGGIAWWGWKGATLRFRVESVHGSVLGAVAGRASVRARFRTTLLERIAESKRRAARSAPPGAGAQG